MGDMLRYATGGKEEGTKDTMVPTRLAYYEEKQDDYEVTPVG